MKNKQLKIKKNNIKINLLNKTKIKKHRERSKWNIR